MTEGGALDDSVRRAMTKLAHLHFTTNKQATNRVLSMGEESWRVFTVGFPAIDLVKDGNFASQTEVAEHFRLDLMRPIVIFTQHSVTTEFEQATDQIKPSLEALKRLVSEGVQVIITYPNNDAGGRHIISEINSFMTNGVPGIQLHRSLGRYNYHGVLALAHDAKVRMVCAGNSSSGIKETPAFGCPTVNIGSRQEGRLRGDNVLDVDYETETILRAIERCLWDEAFRSICRNTENPYGIGDAGKKIAQILATIPIDKS